MTETIILGGGVVGLSLAYELAGRGHGVTLVDKRQPGKKSSWAGAGIIPPTNAQTAIHPLEQLEALSSQIHLHWAHQLLQETGIDNELLPSGGLYLARSIGERAALVGLSLDWRERDIEFERLTGEALREFVPSLKNAEAIESLWVPSEFQLRNPRHLQALFAACLKRGVRLIENTQSLELQFKQNHVQSVRVDHLDVIADVYCIAAGAWSQQLLQTQGLALPMTPVRGQMALFQLPQVCFSPILNEGTRYLVPRADGHVLAGATIEEVGFNSSTQAEDIEELVDWAGSLIQACNKSTLVDAWAGLRPGTYDAFPYLGFVADCDNLLVATGHFKSGLHLSTGTALAMADLIEGKVPAIDLTPFNPNRVSNVRSN